jgi:hypothetical protein
VRYIAATILVLILATTSWSAVEAQSARWTHPRGLYSLDISGWRPVRLGAEARELAVFARGDTGTVSRLCIIHERMVANMADRSQEDLNAFATSFAPPALANNIISDLRQIRINDVVLTAFVRRNAERLTFASIRVFALAPSGTVSEVSCNGTEPLTDLDRSEFERVLNSLRFQTPEPTP